MNHRVLGVLATGFAFAIPSGAQSEAPRHVVVVWSYGFSPRPLHLAPNEAVTLEFVNRSNSSHDFVARRFFQAATIEAGAAPDGEVDLGPHETKSITLIPRAGIYGAHCSHFFHKQMGMSDQILVD